MSWQLGFYGNPEHQARNSPQYCCQTLYAGTAEAFETLKTPKTFLIHWPPIGFISPQPPFFRLLPFPSFSPIALHHMKALMKTKGHICSSCELRYVWTADSD